MLAVQITTALFTGNKSSAPKGKSRGSEDQSQKSATAHNSKVQGKGGATGDTGGSNPTNTQNAGGERNAACFECGKTGHCKSKCPERVCEVCVCKGHSNEFHKMVAMCTYDSFVAMET